VIGIRDEDELVQVKAFVVLQAGCSNGRRGLVRELQKFVRLRAPQRYPRIFEFVESLPQDGDRKDQTVFNCDRVETETLLMTFSEVIHLLRAKLGETAGNSIV